MKQVSFPISTILVLTTMALFGTAFADQPATSAASKEKPRATAPQNTPQKTILFFMNPNGRPCQMQKAILDSIHAQLDTLASIRYYKTTIDVDYEAFNQYGIRGLPSLVIVDKNNKELKRFAPGIQSGDAIIAALKK